MVGAALTKPGRVSTARWCGSGERDGEEYARNRRVTAPLCDTGSKPGGSGPGAARTCRLVWAGNSWGGRHELPGRLRGKTAAYSQRAATILAVKGSTIGEITVGHCLELSAAIDGRSLRTN